MKNISQKDNTEYVSVNILYEKHKLGLNQVHYFALSHIIEIKAKPVQLACKNIKKPLIFIHDKFNVFSQIDIKCLPCKF